MVLKVLDWFKSCGIVNGWIKIGWILPSGEVPPGWVCHRTNRATPFSKKKGSECTSAGTISLSSGLLALTVWVWQRLIDFIGTPLT